MDFEKGVTPLQDFARDKAAIKNSYIKSALAEFLGTFIFVVFAVGAGCHGVLLGPSVGVFGSWLITLLGGSLGLMVAITICGGVSGAHVNPAVTLGSAISGGISWIKVPIYWFMQFFGAYLGSGFAYSIYIEALKTSSIAVTNPVCIEDLTKCFVLAGVFAPIPQDEIAIAFLDQTVGTALLVLVILAASDPRNMKIPTYCYGPLFAVTVVGINCAFGWNAGGVLNPARDIGARLMAISVGYPSDVVFTFGNELNTRQQYWVAPMFGPLLGGVVAAFIYTFLIAAHLKEDTHPELQPYVPNRFNVKPKVHQVESHQQHQEYMSSHRYPPQPLPISYHAGNA